MRSTFASDPHALAQIEKYCEQECIALGLLTAELIARCKSLGITLHRYDGAGAIATTLLTRHKVRQFMRTPPGDVERASLAAYYGGRVEVSRVGEIGDVYTYDIHSAYPSETAKLPCLQHGTWWHVGARAGQILADDPNAIVLAHCSWDTSGQWPAFPWRRLSGGILFPENGTGWHWASEIQAASKSWPGNIVIDDGYWFERGCCHTPFSFIEPLYGIRRSLGLHGDAAEHVLKVGTAAISGKLSQGETRNRAHKPPYQNFTLAGMITAGTRARILDAIATDPDSIVSVATDGIASTRPLPLAIEDTLGGWKEGVMRDLFLVAPGIYSAKLRDGTSYVRTRGFSWHELDFVQLREHWIRYPSRQFEWQGIRFHGMGIARATDWKSWRSWITSTKRLAFFPAQRFPVFGDNPRILLCAPPRFTTPKESTAYDPIDANRWILDGRNETALDMLSQADDGRH